MDGYSTDFKKKKKSHYLSAVFQKKEGNWLGTAGI